MAELSKISGVAIADVAAVDAVLKANIASILGLTLPSGAAFLLDTYTGAAAGYSVRRLASATTVLLRVRRETAGGTGDDDEADVAYDSNNILSLDSAISNASAGVTATTLGQFLNVGTVGGTTYTNPDSLTVTASCFVDEWKDQSGNANHASQATQANQPQIHDGTVDTDLITENGKPTIKFIRTSNTALDMGTLPDFASNYFGASVSTVTIGNQICYIYNTNTDYSTHGVSAFHSSGKAAISSAVTGSSGGKIAATATTNSQILHVGQLVSGTLSLFVDGTEETASTSWAPGTGNYIGRRSDGQLDMEGNIQEVVLWNTDESSNRSGIEENINSDYLIYQPTDTPTSGLLATYSGAAAAYSVRQLANTAVIAMTVRRDTGGGAGDDDEINIGFDANGDLDTQAISDFCGSGTGYVTRWWDQSTNSNHASQATASSQPQIYDGTAVVTENGKPAVNFDGSDDFLAATGAIWSRLAFAGVMYIDVPDDSVALQYGQTNTRFHIGVGGKASANKIASQVYDGAFFGADGADITDGQHLVYNDASISPDTNEMYLNGAAVSQAYESRSGLPSTATYTIGCRGNNAFHFLGKFQEITIWTSDQSSNRTGIETDINDYFSIY